VRRRRHPRQRVELRDSARVRWMGAELLESIPVFSIRPQAMQVEVPALQFLLRNVTSAPLEIVGGLDQIQNHSW
jgi:hypothetical protein